MMQNLYKTDSRFQKSYEEFGLLQTSIGMSKKLKFNGLYLSTNYTPSPKTIFTDLSNITFKWLDEYGKFSPEQLKVLKLGFWWDPLIQS